MPAMCNLAWGLMGAGCCREHIQHTLAGRRFHFSVLLHTDAAEQAIEYLPASSILQACPQLAPTSSASHIFRSVYGL